MEKKLQDINTTEQSSWAPTSHVLVVNCEATKATISATIKAIPVHRYPLSPLLNSDSENLNFPASC